MNNILLPKRTLLHSATYVIALVVVPSIAQANDVKVCNALLNAGLVNQTSETVTRNIASEEFDKFCSVDKDYSSRFATKSNAFQASFSYAGFGAGGGASRASSSAQEDEAFRHVCKENKNKFVSSYTRSFAARDGSEVSRQYNECVKIISDSNVSKLWGWVTQSAQDDETFLIGMDYIAGKQSAPVDLSIASIHTIPSSVECYTDPPKFQENAAITKAAFKNTLILTCKKEKGEDVNGTITVENKLEGFIPKPIKFSLPAIKVSQSAVVKLNDQIALLKEELANQRDIMKGAVVAFAKECPRGWDEYKEAYGRFIRGIDKTGNKVDPDGLRYFGHQQGHMLEGHFHQILRNVEASGTPNAKVAPAPHFYFRYGTSRTELKGGAETRPKNVALLFCKKN